MVSISDFETWDEYVRYREINGYTEHELDCMHHMTEGELDHGYDELNQMFDDLHRHVTSIHLLSDVGGVA